MVYLRFLLLFLFSALLAACQTQAAGEPAPRGRILLWHALGTEEAALLDDILAQFVAIHPGTDVISVAVAPEALPQQYIDTASLGLGPDLLLGPAAWAGQLADAGLIRPLTQDDFGGNDYSQVALEALRLDEAYAGLPFTIGPVALVVNRMLTTVTPETLDALLDQADAGFGVGLDLRADRLFWGIDAVGGSLFDTQGKLSVATSGLAAWLDWLKLAQETPGVILLRDGDVLRDLFVSGRLAYLVTGPELLPAVTERMNPADLAVTTLPAGPGGDAAPLIQAQALLFNAASSQSQAQLALAVAQFLTNVEQSTRLMRDAQLVPANRRARVDRQVYPLLAGFVSQSRQATALPASASQAALADLSDAAVANALSGVLTPEEATCQFALAAVDLGAFAVAETNVPAGCE